MNNNAEEIVEIIFEYITKIQPLREYEEDIYGRIKAVADVFDVLVDPKLVDLLMENLDIF